MVRLYYAKILAFHIVVIDEDGKAYKQANTWRGKADAEKRTRLPGFDNARPNDPRFVSPINPNLYYHHGYDKP